MGNRRALFLDKDGVINVDHGYVSTPERTDFIGGIFELCRAATKHGYLNVVVTNQAGIARGYYTEEAFLDYMDWVRSEFRKHDAQIDAVYYCPHHPTHGLGEYRRVCDCRKPKPGMILAAQHDLGLNLIDSMLVGDSASDTAAGVSAGVGTCIGVQAMPNLENGRAMIDTAALERVLQIMAVHDPVVIPIRPPDTV